MDNVAKKAELAAQYALTDKSLSLQLCLHDYATEFSDLMSSSGMRGKLEKCLAFS